MTKCEKSQECIENLLNQIRKNYEFYLSADPSEFSKMKPTFSLQMRKILMSLRSCIARYAAHIEALKPTQPVGDMPRITYNEEKFDLIPEEKEAEEVYQGFSLD